jgi:predicted Zn-dependent peptidase
MADTRFVVETLDNGLTVVIEKMPEVQSVSCGFLSRTGARDDPQGQAGVSHFLEHMMFKGTPRRHWSQITVDFDRLGSIYNAYTSKDRTFYFGWVRTQDFEQQLEILADMMCSTIPADEFDMEKKVILEEIAMSNDELTSNAYDFLYEKACPNTTLAWPVLGYEETIRNLTRDQMMEYFRRRYAPNNLVLVVAGDVEPARVLETTQKLCGSWEKADDIGGPRQAPRILSGQAAKQLERFHQQAVTLNFPAASASGPMDETAEAVGAILGGTNSRFFWNIIQQGISTRAGAFREEYGDFGLMILFGLCEPENCEKLTEAMRREAEKLTEDGPLDKELRRVKNLRRTSLANESEAPFYRLGQLVDDFDYRGRPRSTEERLADVDAITADTVAEYLQKYPVTGEGYLAAVGPRNWPDND